MFSGNGTPAATRAVEATIALSLSMGLSGFALAGFGTNLLDIVPRFAGAAWGISNTIATIPGVTITGWLVQTTGTYSAAFSLTALLYGIAAIVWLLFAAGEELID